MKTKDKKGQGATEYLLMLAAVLVIVAAAVYYVTCARPTFTITAATGYPKVSGTDNTQVLFVADKVTPSTLANADTTLAVYKQDGTKIGSTSSDVTSGETITITVTEAVPADSELRIIYKGSTKTFPISTK